MPFYNNNYQDSQSHYRIAPGRSISVIAAFNDDGKIKPLRIRLKTSEGHIEANIDKMISVKKSSTMIQIFECLVTTDNVQNQIRLYYDSSTNKWSIGEERHI